MAEETKGDDGEQDIARTLTFSIEQSVSRGGSKTASSRVKDFFAFQLHDVIVPDDVPRLDAIPFGDGNTSVKALQRGSLPAEMARAAVGMQLVWRSRAALACARRSDVDAAKDCVCALSEQRDAGDATWQRALAGYTALASPRVIERSKLNADERRLASLGAFVADEISATAALDKFCSSLSGN